MFALAAAQKRPSVQSDKVPISQSCDSDFLSVCTAASEGWSIGGWCSAWDRPPSPQTHARTAWRDEKKGGDAGGHEEPSDNHQTTISVASSESSLKWEHNGKFVSGV